MAGKPKPMSQVKQILRMHAGGKGIKTIARSLAISKNTVKDYLRKAEVSRIGIQELLNLEDPVLEQRLLSGNPAYKDERYDQLKDRLDHYVKELKKVGVTRGVLHQEYCQSTSEPYGYSQFCYHLQQHRKSSKPSMVLEHLPGDKLFIDFAGKTLSYIDRETGEIVEVQVFVACLPYSDYGFVMAVPSQKLEDFLYALGCCLNHLEGVPHCLVPDNLKSAIAKANIYEPDINRALEDFANHYHTTVIPARPARPKDKALVENQVRTIYSRVFAKLRNRQFFDLASLNQAIFEKVKLHNQTRMQQKEYCREEKFLADEREHLLELPIAPFEIKYYREHKVAKNNHIYLSQDKHYYSVPYSFIGEKAKVIYTRSLVNIYCRGKQIAVHPRGFKKGGYTTKKEHLCSHHQFYKDRSPSHYLQRASAHSELLYCFMEALFKQNKHPEQLYKTCDGILNLSRKAGGEVFNSACKIALEHQNYSYMFLKRLVENHMPQDLHNPINKPLPGHGNIRGASAYK